MSNPIKFLLQILESVASLLEWVVRNLSNFGLPLPLWLFQLLVAGIFIFLSVWIWKVKKPDFHWSVRAIGTLVFLIFPVSAFLSITGYATHIIGVNLPVLQQYVREKQKDIVLLPYELSVHNKATFESDINRDIIMYAQDLNLRYRHTNIDLVPLPANAFTERIPVTDGDWMRKVGREVNALSIVGIMENDQSKFIRAWMNIIPETDMFQVATVPIDDNSYANPKLYDHVRQQWGRATVLAIAVRELSRGLGNQEDRQALEDARRYFLEVRKKLGGDEESLAAEISTVVEQIDRVLEE